MKLKQLPLLYSLLHHQYFLYWYLIIIFLLPSLQLNLLSWSRELTWEAIRYLNGEKWLWLRWLEHMNIMWVPSQFHSETMKHRLNKWYYSNCEQCKMNCTIHHQYWSHWRSSLNLISITTILKSLCLKHLQYMLTFLTESFVLLDRKI